MDVIQLLKKDHKLVKNLFQEFENLKGKDGQKKLNLMTQIEQALTVHAQIEEELVYPAFLENRPMKEQVCEALEEHHVTKMLLSELGDMRPDDARYDAKVKVLYEYLMHHVKEEEKEMFPGAQKRLSAKRLSTLGEELETRRSELMAKSEKRRDRKMEDMRDKEEDEDSQEERRKEQRHRQYAA